MKDELDLTKDMLDSADRYNQEVTTKMKELEAENARLREALEEYAYTHFHDCASRDNPPLDAARFCDCTLGNIARAALEGK